MLFRFFLAILGLFYFFLFLLFIFIAFFLIFFSCFTFFLHVFSCFDLFLLFFYCFTLFIFFFNCFCLVFRSLQNMFSFFWDENRRIILFLFLRFFWSTRFLLHLNNFCRVSFFRIDF